MGYPMTWKRVLNRNGLQDGDYGQAPTRHRTRVNIEAAIQEACRLEGLEIYVDFHV